MLAARREDSRSDFPQADWIAHRTLDAFIGTFHTAGRRVAVICGRGSFLNQPTTLPAHWTKVLPSAGVATTGVATRTYKDRGGNTIAHWTYEPELELVPSGNEPNELKVTVTDPLGNTTRHYFSVDRDGLSYDAGSWNAFEYGLPFSHLIWVPATLFRGAASHQRQRCKPWRTAWDLRTWRTETADDVRVLIRVGLVRALILCSGRVLSFEPP
jgi:hypothetical protein